MLLRSLHTGQVLDLGLQTGQMPGNAFGMGIPCGRQKHGWLQMVCPTAEERRFMEDLVRRSRLDRGEAEAIAFASTRKLLLIVDDKVWWCNDLHPHT